jgi:hypothetical protein
VFVAISMHFVFDVCCLRVVVLLVVLRDVVVVVVVVVEVVVEVVVALVELVVDVVVIHLVDCLVGRLRVVGSVVVGSRVVCGALVSKHAASHRSY